MKQHKTSTNINSYDLIPYPGSGPASAPEIERFHDPAAVRMPQAGGRPIFFALAGEERAFRLRSAAHEDQIDALVEAIRDVARCTTPKMW